MPIVYKSPLSSSVANATFLDKTIADLKTGKLSLCKVDTLEPGYIDDVQVAINTNTDNVASNTSDIIGINEDAVFGTENFFSTKYDEKTELVDDDVFIINDSENLGEAKYVKAANLTGGGGGGAGSSIEWIDGDIAPGNEYSNGLVFRTFEEATEQEMFFSLTVPESYKAGDQIKLSSAKVIAGGFSESYKLVTRTYLIDSADYTSRADYHDSTNLGSVGTAGAIISLHDMDLTDGSGEINSIAIAPLDTILVRITRDSVSLDTIKMIKNSPIIKLK